MQSIFQKVPVWFYFCIGLVAIACAVPGFLSLGENSARQEALQGEPPEMIDLAAFTEPGVAGEVHFYAQTSPEYRFLVDGTVSSNERLLIVPLFEASADASQKLVEYALVTRDFDGFEAWMAANKLGTGQIGNLQAVNGRIEDAQGFTAAMRVTFRDAGLEQSDTLVLFEPFTQGREAGLSQATSSAFGNPFVLCLIGAAFLGLGVYAKRNKQDDLEDVPLNVGKISKRAMSLDEALKSKTVAEKKDKEASEKAPKSKTVRPKAEIKLAKKEKPAPKIDPDSPKTDISRSDLGIEVDKKKAS